MSTSQTSHQFAAAQTAQIANLHSSDCKLEIRQQPMNARVAVGKEKDRKPVDPPPIIQLRIPGAIDPHQNYLQSPYFFLSCSLLNNDTVSSNQLPAGTLGTALAGTLVSSLHRLKDTNNQDGAFFVFGDLSVKCEGIFRLQFNLYQMQEMECAHVASITSDTFVVHSAKNFAGMAESTFLTRTFSDQGVRLRLRKEPRTLLRKRGPADDNYQPRTYNKATGRSQNSEGERQPVTSPDSQDSMSQSQSQNEQVDPMTAHTNAFEHRPALPRHYSEQSTVPYNGGNSYEESAKRPRTGSDQSQASSFGHQSQVLDSSHYNTRAFSDPQPSYNTYASQLPQSSNYASYTNSYYQSPTQSRDPFNKDPTYPFAPKINTQTGSIAFDSQRSPSSGFFQGSYTSTAAQGQYSSHILPTTGGQRVQHAQTALTDLSLGRMHLQTSPLSTQSVHSMAPPTGRTPYSLAAMQPRRDSSNNYPVFSTEISQSLPIIGTQTYPVRTDAPNPSESPIEGFR